MSRRSRLSVALVGCGRIAQVHQQYLAEIPEAELVAVCDADAAARSAMSARAAVPAYASFDELLRCAAPQVVHIVTPPPTHAPLALRALASGAHVFIE
ncbi:MAG TPA: Gfo/Idh/MocA family oxidoreductase, partial [Candidatus Kryptonia bacterium]|nr:Gfo/Idh/MocA family oxidoreductase [Candidatus Kryptonia bacterium]